MKKITTIIVLLLLSVNGEAAQVSKEERPLESIIQQSRIHRSQLERIRRRTLTELGRRPDWMHDINQLKKVYETIVAFDSLIIQTYLIEQDYRDEQEDAHLERLKKGGE